MPSSRRCGRRAPRHDQGLEAAVGEAVERRGAVAGAGGGGAGRCSSAAAAQAAPAQAAPARAAPRAAARGRRLRRAHQPGERARERRRRRRRAAAVTGMGSIFSGGGGGGDAQDRDAAGGGDAAAAAWSKCGLAAPWLPLAWGGLGPVWRFCHADPGPARAASLCGGLPASRLRRRGQPGAAMVKLVAKQLQARAPRIASTLACVGPI